MHTYFVKNSKAESVDQREMQLQPRLLQSLVEEDAERGGEGGRRRGRVLAGGRRQLGGGY